MTWKVVNISDTGTGSKFGANDMDKVSKLFGNVNVDTVQIVSPWKFDQTTGLDMKAITEPSSPASGYIRLFVDSADSKLKMKRSNGDVVIIE